MAHDSASSPTSSTDSGTTTNPNTPRPEYERGHGNVFEAAMDESTSRPRPSNPALVTADEVLEVNSSPSDDSYRRLHNIQPTWPRRINITNAPATASWQPDSRLEKVFLDVHWVPSGDKAGAFFKIHTRVRSDRATRTRRTRRDGGVSIFIFIPPERIRELSFDPQPDARPLGPNTVALTFDMTRPPALVLPKTFVAAGQKAESTIVSLHTLATQSLFTLHATIPDRTVPEAWMRQLCAAISAHRLSSIERLAFPVVPTLYQGQGGQVLEGDCLPDHDVIPDARALPHPPAYDDVDASPLLPPAFPPQGKKRRRSGSPSNKTEAASEAMDRAAVESLLDARLCAHKHEIAEMHQAHKHEVAEMHKAHKLEVVELLSAHKSEVMQLLEAHELELTNKLDSSEARVENSVVDGLMSIVDEKIWKEVAAVEDHVMDRITSMPLRAELTFPDHPLY